MKAFLHVTISARVKSGVALEYEGPEQGLEDPGIDDSGRLSARGDHTSWRSSRALTHARRGRWGRSARRMDTARNMSTYTMQVRSGHSGHSDGGSALATLGGGHGQGEYVPGGRRPQLQPPQR